MTATKTRHLHSVPDPTDTYPVPAADQEAVHLGTVLTLRQAQLAEAHDAATEAAFMPDVIVDQDAAIERLMARLATPGNDIHALLRDYGRAMYVHGYMDATASLEAEVVVAEIRSLDAYRTGGDPA